MYRYIRLMHRFIRPFASIHDAMHRFIMVQIVKQGLKRIMHRFIGGMYRFISSYASIHDAYASIHPGQILENEKNPIISKTVSIITFEPFIGIGRSLYRTEGKNMLYHLVMRDFIFTRLLPDFSGKPFI